MEKQEVKVMQGTNDAWFIYLNGKVICGSHSKEWIDKFEKVVSTEPKKFPTDAEILTWLKEEKFQTEQGEQDYIMMFQIDMPRILKRFLGRFSIGA